MKHFSFYYTSAKCFDSNIGREAISISNMEILLEFHEAHFCVMSLRAKAGEKMFQFTCDTLGSGMSVLGYNSSFNQTVLHSLGFC